MRICFTIGALSMRPRTLLATLHRAEPLSSRRCLAGCGRPLAVLAVLLGGATLFGGALSLLGARQPTAIFFAAAEGLASDSGILALPVHEPSAHREAALDRALAGLDGSAFGITFARPATLAADRLGGDDMVASLVPHVQIDADRPPLRVEIMGMDQLAHRLPRRAEVWPR
jgi:hypothetical protein